MLFIFSLVLIGLGVAFPPLLVLGFLLMGVSVYRNWRKNSEEKEVGRFSYKNQYEHYMMEAWK